MLKSRLLSGVSFRNRFLCSIDPPAGGDAGGAGGGAGGEQTILGGGGGDPPAKKDGGDTEPKPGADAKPGDWKEYTPDPAKSEADNATAKAAHDKTKPAAAPKDEKHAPGKDPNKSDADNAKDLADHQAKMLETAKSYELKVPDGFEPNPAMREKFNPIVAKHGLSKEAAQDLVNFEAEIRNDAIKEHLARVKQWATDAEKDKDFGGTKYPETKKAASTAVAEFGDPEFIQLLNHTGYGNHPALVRFCARVGQSMGEGSTRKNEQSQQPKGKSAEDVFYGS